MAFSTRETCKKELEYPNPQEASEFKLPRDLKRTLKRIIRCELENFFVVEGDRAEPANLARDLSKQPQWKSCHFVLLDATHSGSINSVSSHFRLILNDQATYLLK